jgi:hypothetical protein
MYVSISGGHEVERVYRNNAHKLEALQIEIRNAILEIKVNFIVCTHKTLQTLMDTQSAHVAYSFPSVCWPIFAANPETVRVLVHTQINSNVILIVPLNYMV